LKPALAAALLVAAACLGFAYGYYGGTDPAPAPDSSAIEWNEVQEVPKAAPRPEDQEWEKRAEEQDSPSTGSGRTDERGSTIAGQQIRVIDGDTFRVGGETIRVAGIDAPETHPARCPQEAQLGAAATQRLAALLRGGTLWISGEKTDAYGRSVRTVRVNGEDVAEAMIGSGLARSYDGKQRQGWC
jgi:endonuclease YncB( thermonuclease family)